MRVSHSCTFGLAASIADFFSKEKSSSLVSIIIKSRFPVRYICMSVMPPSWMLWGISGQTLLVAWYSLYFFINSGWSLRSQAKQCRAILCCECGVFALCNQDDLQRNN
mmetsp:Transcript_810/g.1943  ORF Transcript_810/g.1943 Transcript_810/m.1943 type:complete len:108 (-) Transcript_810:48-371(-)